MCSRPAGGLPKLDGLALADSRRIAGISVPDLNPVAIGGAIAVDGITKHATHAPV